MATWEITTSNDSLEFDTVKATHNSCFAIDSNHFINFWSGDGDDGFVQVFTVNTSTWAVTTAGARLEFDTVQFITNDCFQIDSNHFISTWSGTDGDGFAQVFTVNTSTWAVTTAGARLEFDTADYLEPTLKQVDPSHFITFWSGVGFDGFVQILEINTSTWEITTSNASLEFDTVSGRYNSCFAIDSNHFINFWAGESDDGYVQVFTVNTSTWAVTTAGARLEFDTIQGFYNDCFQIDSNHFINFWTGPGNDGFVQVFTVNTSTWAVTTAGASLEFDTISKYFSSCYQVDSNHFINFWGGGATAYIGAVQVFEINTSTWEITTSNASLEFDTAQGWYSSCGQIDANHFINFWSGSGNDGFVQVFTVDGQVSINGNIKYWDGSEWQVAPVKRWNGTVWEAVNLQYWDGENWQSVEY